MVSLDLDILELFWRQCGGIPQATSLGISAHLTLFERYISFPRSKHPFDIRVVDYGQYPVHFEKSRKLFVRYRTKV